MKKLIFLAGVLLVDTALSISGSAGAFSQSFQAQLATEREHTALANVAREKAGVSPRGKVKSAAGRVIRTRLTSPRQKFSNNQAAPGAFFSAVYLPFGAAADGFQPFGDPIVGDFNGDGKLDVASTVYGLSFAWIGVFLGNGDGTFKPAVLTGLPEATTITSGDVNKDNRTDILAYGNSLYIFISNGDGSFTQRQTYTLTSFSPGTVLLADNNADGKLDMVMVGGDSSILPFQTVIATMLGNGDGTFQPPVFKPLAIVGSGSLSLPSLADLNGDGKLDVMFFYYSGGTSKLQGRTGPVVVSTVPSRSSMTNAAS